MDKQFGFAVILIILGFGINLSDQSDDFSNGISVGLIIMGTLWVVIRLHKEIKK